MADVESEATTDLADALTQVARLVRERKLSEAIAECERAVERFPGEPKPLDRLGSLLVLAGRESEAVGPYLRCAAEWERRGLELRAMAVYQLMLQYHLPEERRIHAGRARVYIKSGMPREAWKSLKEAYALFPDAADLMH